MVRGTSYTTPKESSFQRIAYEMLASSPKTTNIITKDGIPYIYNLDKGGQIAKIESESKAKTIWIEEPSLGSTIELLPSVMDRLFQHSTF